MVFTRLAFVLGPQSGCLSYFKPPSIYFQAVSFLRRLKRVKRAGAGGLEKYGNRCLTVEVRFEGQGLSPETCLAGRTNYKLPVPSSSYKR
jgi:hypothetical protein